MEIERRNARTYIYGGREVRAHRGNFLCILLCEEFEEGLIELAPNINLELGKERIIGIEILKVTKLFREEALLCFLFS